MAEPRLYATEKRIDTRTAPKLDADLKEILGSGQYDIIIDMADTVYISSVGLRALLSAQKTVNANAGSMVIRNACEAVKDVFDVTGFSGLLTIED